MSNRPTHPLRLTLPLILIALVCLWGCSKQQQPSTTSSAPPPTPKTLPAHGPGEVDPTSCGASTTHGANYKAIACPEVCKASVTTHTVALDYYFDNPNRDNDPDLCMHFSSTTETLTYTTNGSNGRTIQVMRYENDGHEGHPFKDSEAPPYPHGAPGASAKVGHLDPGRKPPSGKCFEFEGYVLVKENGKSDRCFDPHIYTQ